MDLATKRAAIASDASAQERFDPHWRSVAEAGGKLGPKLTDRPVAFQCDDEVVVIGDDVGKVLDGLAKFNELAKSEGWQNRAKAEPAVAQAIAKAAKVAGMSPTPSEIRVTTQIWNGLSFALGEVGVLVQLSDGVG